MAGAEAIDVSRLSAGGRNQPFEVVFEPVAWNPIAVPGLVVAGEGTAWFDDIELVELPK